MVKISKEMIILFVIFAIVLVGIAILLGGSFYNSRNFVSMGFQIPEFGFLALAMSLAMLTGGIDLSIIGNMNLSGILAALILTNQSLLSTAGTTVTVVLAILVALLFGLICGALNGILIGYIRIPAMLATIGTMLFYTGVGMAITGGRGVVGFPEIFMLFGNSRFLGLPIPLLIMFIIFALVALALEHTVWGRSVYLVGNNYIAALFSGVRTTKTIILTYMIGGLMCGFSALILISRVNSARIGYGDTYLLQAILVSVMGGINPEGGSGKVLGVLLSILILQSLSSSFTLFAITPYARGLIYGLMLLIIMIVNYVYGEGSKRSLRKAKIKQ
ncbi:MAG TPA: ABC transporter permease [Atribacter sp.]|jgi:simple sugar transport system permease protein|uniref:Ribose transport system permease protein RbsC n=1 Tax=Candidatus Atribacter allofermentans TaxID=1852833 RepID=A0A1V5SUW5_9BACT|nr:ABC transporter permease [Atribacter sp.]MDD3714245.1 ABC transporter permease [Atribacterota bacterium]OQA58033.1 MAG: Ribose transport system permease protein RbsC [Candidatus Atribacteria bacterium ADurb.Bin276]HHT08820.1 ABC transporter permease [Candidatus Atribacteria bacterium]HOT05561.1 ABC transporter permease [Atribacter sp.]HQK83004.1 ABC transporter permease [Atribacter sp.]